MGQVLSFISLFNSEDDYKVRKAVERELSLIAQHTTWEVEELRELHAAFLSQYPTGFISPQQFVDENTEAIGGPPELWHHYFNLISHPPLVRRRQGGPSGGQSGSGLGMSGLKMNAGGNDGDNNNNKNAIGSALAAQQNSNSTRDRSPARVGGGTGSISERLAAANRGDHHNATANKRMKTSLVSTSNPTEDLDLDPRVVGLTFSHVMLRLSRSLYNASEQKLKYLFNFYDVNQDGLISFTDLETAFTWLYQVPLVHSTQLYQDLDQDQRDPSIRAETLLRLWDRDGDGLLNQDEFVEMGRADPDLLELLSALRK